MLERPLQGLSLRQAQRTTQTRSNGAYPAKPRTERKARRVGRNQYSLPRDWHNFAEMNEGGEAVLQCLNTKGMVYSSNGQKYRQYIFH